MTSENKPQIMIVDDEQINLRLINAHIKNDYLVKVAMSGAQALERAATDPRPDLILLDVQMPDMDGFEVCQQLKRQPETAEIPVIFVTAQRAEADELKGLACGGIDFISKPIQPNVLMARIKIHITQLYQQRELERMNQAIKASHDRMEQQAAALREANRELQHLGRMKSDFLSSVSHELRTPLTSILGFAKLIRRDFQRTFVPLIQADNRQGQQRGQRILGNLDIIITEGERLTRLINDVLDLSKIESGRMDWNLTTFPIQEAVQQAFHAAAGQFNGRPVSCTLQLPEAPIHIAMDRDKLIQVLINLLNNAAKFTQQGCVTLMVRQRAPDSVWLGVQDTGPGIPEDQLQQVFDKFHQVNKGDTLVDKPKGTGLGLAICKEIIEYSQGKIWVESRFGKGCTFQLELPVSEPESPVREEH